MTTLKVAINYLHDRPIMTGLFTVLLTVAFGMSLAFAIGLVTPAQVFAQVVGPDCCIISPPPPPPPPPPLPTPPLPPLPVVGCMDKTATNYNPNATAPAACTYPPVIGCMDSTATNYNPKATSQTGITCTYPIAPVLGCMDSTATNYNPKATSQTGITCTYPAKIIYGCMDSTATNYNPAATSQTGITCTYAVKPVYGCMDSTATNYNAAATSQTGITCTYAVKPVYGCMDSTATNYNPKATSQTGITCTYATAPTCQDHSATNYGHALPCTYPVTPPGPTAPTCTLTATPSSIITGASSVLSWTTTHATSFSINQSVGSTTPIATGTISVSPSATLTYTGTAIGTGGSVTCATTITVTAPSNGGGAGGGGSGGGGAGGGPVISSGGGGGATLTPNITLSVLPHIGAQPLAYLYLSQIPYTGLDLGTTGTILYWLVLIGCTIVLAYLALFGVVPFLQQSMRDFGTQVALLLNTPKLAVATGGAPTTGHHHAPTSPSIEEETVPDISHNYSPYEGFKSFAHNNVLSIEDIVKGLSREHAARASEPVAVPVPNVLPTLVHTEPIYDHVEPIAPEAPQIQKSEPETLVSAPADIRGFTAALVQGDRVAVFAGLRQFVRGGGAPEVLVSSVACLLDDTYRARVDGSLCDETIARLTARLETPLLEKLIAALTTAIDSSYTDHMTGAKLALTRALAVLGA
jgi:hypothetical protein